MKAFNFYGYHVAVDTDSTSAWYASAQEWGCDCGHCRNFRILAKQRKLPLPVLEILDDFGIPPEKATYVCEIFPDKDGFRYQFSYRLAGEIIHSPDHSPSLPWGQCDCCHEPYPHGAPGFPMPHFDLEFWITLPWVLMES